MNQVARLEPELPAATTPMAMIERAVASGASIDTIGKLMDLQERWERNQARKAFDDAMAAAKAEIPVIFKNREVDFTSQKGRTNYRHEDLAGIARTVDPILAKHGLSYRFRTSSDIGQPVTVTCVVSHRMGHYEENTLSAGRDETGNKNSHQAVASAVTYLSRYTLKAALGLAASDDDDGAKADAPATLNDEQATRVQQLVLESGANVAAFLNYMKAESISDIPASKYKEAVSMLEQKKRAKQS